MNGCKLRKLAWKIGLSVSMLVVISASVCPTRADGPATEPAPARFKVVVELAELVEAHNAIRLESGLPALEPAPKLVEAARIHALDMAKNNKMAHEGSDGSTPGERVERVGYPVQNSGENVAAGYSKVEEVMDGWMNSEGHRKNILGDFQEIGAAMVLTADDVRFWAVEFGTPWPKLDPAEASEGLLAAINEYREESKRPALRQEARLARVAQSEVEKLARRDSLELKAGEESAVYERIKQAGYRFRRIGIAHASGQPTGAEVVESWVEQEGPHREQLLGRFTHVGIGHARNDGGKPFWTLIIAQPLR